MPRAACCMPTAECARGHRPPSVECIIFRKHVFASICFVCFVWRSKCFFGGRQKCRHDVTLITMIHHFLISMLAAAQLQRRQHSGHEPSTRLEAPSEAHPPLMFSHCVSKSGGSTKLIHSTCFFPNRPCHMHKYVFARTKTSATKLICVASREMK